jgi:membrane protease YdiL (CAAX protease family)
MLSAKPWKAEAVARLILSVVVSVFAGSVLVIAFQAAGEPHGPDVKALLMASAAFIFLGGTLFLIRGHWKTENFVFRAALLLFCFYAAIFLGAWAQKRTGATEHGVVQMLVGTISFQGTALLWIWLFLREHETGWAAGFGFSNQWFRAVLLGIIAAAIYLPIGHELQSASFELLLRFHMKPEAQVAVQSMQKAVTVTHRLALGFITVFLVPPAEEVLFRGILYPWVKQAGFPRLALWGTSLLFGAIHFYLVGFVPLAVLALGLTLLYEWTGNLLAPITAHALFNAWGFVTLYRVEQQIPY